MKRCGKHSEVAAHLLESCALSIMEDTLANPVELTKGVDLLKTGTTSRMRTEKKLKALKNG